jgi:hypothetical protein
MKRHNVIAAIGALFLAVMAWQPDRPAPVYVTPQPAPVVYAATAAPQPEPPPPASLTDAHIRAAQMVIAEHGFPVPSLRLSVTHVRAEVQLTEQPPLDIDDYAKAAVLAMRNALYVMHDADPDWFYSLTIYGPSPGPGLIQVIGNAKMKPTGPLQWTFGKRA